MRSSLARILEERPGALPAQWRFWLIVGLIALGGAVLRALLHDYGLPWVHSIEGSRSGWLSTGSGACSPQMYSSRSPLTRP